MALHNQLGALGEEVAAHYLSQLEYRLLERNWRTGHLEVDIIADYYGEIVFVEVKTRSYEAEYTALEAVDKAKKKAPRTCGSRLYAYAPFGRRLPLRYNNGCWARGAFSGYALYRCVFSPKY